MSHEPGRERHMTYRCENCGDRLDGPGLYFGDADEYWCESCYDNEQERRWQRHQDDLMENGPGPTLADIAALAMKMRAR